MFRDRLPSRQKKSISHRDPIVIALLNNMPDAALEGTERQFCALLSAASRDFVVRLKLYSLPEIARSDATRSHISRYYDDIAELEDDPPDGLIVTGTEPRARSLSDEPFWPALSKLVAWSNDHTISSIWSCLAAHAAVLHLDSIDRRPLDGKLSGVFDCQIGSADHDIVWGTPGRWRVPHSRFYDLPEEALAARGYDILSRSPHSGVDIFLKQADSLFLFFQGHPEYGAASLLKEYRRDVTRFLSRERETYPGIPHGYFNAHVASELVGFQERALRDRSLDLLPEFGALVARAELQAPWFSTAVRIYANWLSYLDSERTRRASPDRLHEVNASLPHPALTASTREGFFARSQGGLRSPDAKGWFQGLIRPG